MNAKALLAIAAASSSVIGNEITELLGRREPKPQSKSLARLDAKWKCKLEVRAAKRGLGRRLTPAKVVRCHNAVRSILVEIK